jgi:DNA adenine methylase
MAPLNVTDMMPTRPALRYLGGKWKLAPWIISHFPLHRVYLEPFGGAASVLLRKPRAPGECYNDIDGALVNLFAVLRDVDTSAELCRRLILTPFSRAEYDLAFEPTDDSVERARRLVVRSYMGHGSSSAISARSTGFRASLVNRGGALPAGEWPGMPGAMHAITNRMQGVLLECRPALQVIDRYDAADTLIYLDPPYVQGTRSAKRRGGKAFHAYAYELTDADHVALLERIQQSKAMVVISGYANHLYDERLGTWSRVTFATHADGALDRTEVLWINPACAQALDREKRSLHTLMAGAE